MKEAERVYQKITGYVNYSEMNGIEKEWIIKCIDEAINKPLNIYGVMPMLQKTHDILEVDFSKQTDKDQEKM